MNKDSLKATCQRLSYEYKSIFSDRRFEICAYNIETMLAEKIQTIYQRGVFNSRSKDFYDVHILYHLQKEEIDFEHLKKACQNTFMYRNTHRKLKCVVKYTPN